MNRVVDSFEFKEIEISKILNSYSATSKRKNSKDDLYEYELSESIKIHGLLQPIGVGKSTITESSSDFQW